MKKFLVIGFTIFAFLFMASTEAKAQYWPYGGGRYVVREYSYAPYYGYTNYRRYRRHRRHHRPRVVFSIGFYSRPRSYVNVWAISPSRAVLVTKCRAPIRRNVNEIVSLLVAGVDAMRGNLLSVLGLSPLARSLPFNQRRRSPYKL
jgi:hypothetical protein